MFHAGEILDKIDPSYHDSKSAGAASAPSVPVARDASSFTVH